MPEQTGINIDALRSEAIHDLISKAKAGDQMAVRALIPPIMEYLFPCIYKILQERLASGGYLSETLQPGGSEHIREDAWQITHASCCSVLKHLPTFRGRNMMGKPVLFTTWLYSIGKNEVRTTLRSRWRERNRRVDMADDLSWERLEDGSIQSRVEEKLEEDESAKEVLKALENAPLTPEQREAITLFYVMGFPQTKIATTTGVGVGTVKKRIFDGLKKIRKYMDEKNLLEKEAK